MKRQRIGIVTGLLGNLLFGWGLYHTMRIGTCGGIYAPCPSYGWIYIVAVPAGMIVSMISIFAGGLVIFATTFGTVGVASILVGINGGVGAEGDTTFPLVFGAIFLVPALLPLFFIPSARRQKKQGAQLRARGKKAVATVMAVEDTGGTVNENPHVRLKLSIVPNGAGGAFEGETAMVVSRVDVPRPGDRYPVWYDPQDTTKFEIGNKIQAAEPAAVPEPQAPERPTEWVSELGKLNDLRLSGALTDEEFNRAKDRLLAGSPPGPAGG